MPDKAILEDSVLAQSPSRLVTAAIRMVRDMTRPLMFEDRDTRSTQPENDHPTTPQASVLPTPLSTAAAAGAGGLAGLATIYAVAHLLADTVAGVAVIAVVFAVTMAGPWVHARADNELGRALAVGLQAVAFGGALAAILIVT